MKDTIWIKKGRFTPLAVVLMFAFPLVTALICLCFGRMNVPVGEVLTALRTALTGESTSNVQNYSIVINLRLPRILMAIIVGAVCLVQAVPTNPYSPIRLPHRIFWV